MRFGHRFKWMEATRRTITWEENQSWALWELISMWFRTATHQRSTSAIALNHNQNQPLVYLLSAWEEEGFVQWTRGVHKHTEQKLTPNLSFDLGRAWKERPTCSDAVRKYGQRAPRVMACQRDETSLLSAGWQHASARDTVSLFEAAAFLSPHKSLFSNQMRVPYFQHLRSHMEGDLSQDPAGTI